LMASNHALAFSRYCVTFNSHRFGTLCGQA
jgi:hypothetical protein